MKRFLACILAITLLIAAFPLAGLADAPAVTYSEDDVISAVSSLGRMPALYSSLATIALKTLDVTPSQAESLTKKLYTVWAFLEEKAYSISVNSRIKDVMTKDQWLAIQGYIYDYGTPALNDLILRTIGSLTASMLKKGGVPRDLLGVHVDNVRGAMAGQEATVKIYTTDEIKDGVYIADSRGQMIKNSVIVVKPYHGSLGTFYEHIVKFKYPSAGKVSLRVCGVDPKYPTKNYYAFTVTVAKANTRDVGTTTNASVLSVSAGAAALGGLTEFTVTTNELATCAKITDKKGNLLAFGTEVEDGSPAGTKVFKLYYSFPSTGKHSVRAYAGEVLGDNALWNNAYRTATATVVSPLAGVSIARVTVSRGQYRGGTAKITVYASKNATRARLSDASNTETVFTGDSTLSPDGKYNVFELEYTQNKAGTYKMYVQVGNESDWYSKRPAVMVTFAAPYASSISAAPALRGTNATITVKVSPTVTSVRLLNPNLQQIGLEKTPDGSGVCTFDWSQDSAGRKTVYVEVNDGLGWTSRKAGSVTFLAPTISVSAPRVPRNTPATIKVTASSTVTKVQFYTSTKAVPVEITAPNAFEFSWTSSTKGKKTIYFKIYDGISWSGFIKSSVTFT